MQSNIKLHTVSCFNIQKIHRHFTRHEEDCPVKLNHSLGLEKLASLFAMLTLAYLISGAFCALEVMTVREDTTTEEKPETSAVVSLKNTDKLLQLNLKERCKIIRKLQVTLDDCLSELK